MSINYQCWFCFSIQRPPSYSFGQQPSYPESSIKRSTGLSFSPNQSWPRNLESLIYLYQEVLALVFLTLRRLSLSLAEPPRFCADWDIFLAFKGPSSAGPSLPLVTGPELACPASPLQRTLPSTQAGRTSPRSDARRPNAHGSRLSAAAFRPAARSPAPSSTAGAGQEGRAVLTPGSASSDPGPPRGNTPGR